MTVDELCLNQPAEFREYMNYCRSLNFIADPDYKYLYNLFEGCSERHGWDIRQPDFIWNKNRLYMERENLKASMMRVIKKPAKKEDEQDGDEGVG